MAEWQNIIPTPMMCSLLEKHFFPKWMQTLVMWLNQSPNLDQVSRWYSGWKQQMNDTILTTQSIKGDLPFSFVFLISFINCFFV